MYPCFSSCCLNSIPEHLAQCGGARKDGYKTSLLGEVRKNLDPCWISLLSWLSSAFQGFWWVFFLVRDWILVGKSRTIRHNHVTEYFRQSILRTMLNYLCWKGLGYKLIVSQVFWIWSTIIKLSSLTARGVWRWETWKKREGKCTHTVLGCHLLCFHTLLPGYSSVCYPGVLSVFQLFSFMFPVLKFLKCSIKVAHQLILPGCRTSLTERAVDFSQGLLVMHLRGSEFSSHPLNYACMN